MKKNGVIDIMITLISTSLFLILRIYREQTVKNTVFMGVAGTTAIVFLILAVVDIRKVSRLMGGTWFELPEDAKVIMEAVLLSEEDTELMVWDMYGKTSLVIGRDFKENQVDIDLSESPYASMVDIEHAVLNFSYGTWFVEDLGSKNGISVKKDDSRVYRLSADTPCRLDRGDCLYVGRNRLLFR